MVVAEYEGGRYLVSMLGKDANWCSTSASPGGGRQVLTAWPAPVTAYGEFEGLRLPAGGKAVWKLPDADLDYIDVTITELHYDAAQLARCPRPRRREGLACRCATPDGWDAAGAGRCPGG